MIHLSFVVPAHNEEVLLAHNVGRLVERLRALPSARVLIVENGSTDGTWAIAQGLAGVSGGVAVEAAREERAGLGGAYDRALRELGQRPAPRLPHWVCLGAADLPFGFTDLDRALPRMAEEGAPPVLLGSKAHPESRVSVSSKRRAASVAYRLLRRALLGMRVGDCQGTLFLRAELALALRPHVRSRDYFYTTELVCLLERSGVPIVELPVELSPDERKSTVSLFRDGARMGGQLLALRRRVRREGVPVDWLHGSEWTRPTERA
ncbi:MAG: glycosyltransferase family 2 protein [Myxococcota bacterium]